MSPSRILDADTEFCYNYNLYVPYSSDSSPFRLYTHPNRPDKLEEGANLDLDDTY